jgi:hypothetical protein
MKWSGLAIIAALAWLAGAGPAQAQDDARGTAHWQSATELAALFEAHGYSVATGEESLIWLIAADGTRVVMTPLSDRGETCCSGVRLEALWLVGDSVAARQIALDYERTNFLATLAITRAEAGTIIHLQRDILLARERSPANVVANAGLLFQLIPYFQSALVEADPALNAYWASLQESGQ